MSMPNIYQLDRDRLDLPYNEAVVEVLAKLIAARIDVDAVFDDRERIRELARYSGGHVRQLMQSAAGLPDGRNAPQNPGDGG